ncbi:MAG TPA: amidohydrolase family protein [Cellulomonas sp.]
MRGRIDTHQHYVPPFYRDLLDAGGLTAGGWPTPAWSARGALAMMDTRRIATGVLSLSSPGVRLGDDAQARDLARRANEHGAELVKDRPDRFGLFASLPLPDVDGALAELAYAFDVLGADGVVLMSSVQGTYPGDPAYAPLWAELDARRAVVFLHPDAPAIAPLPGLPSPLVDFPFDTTRAAVHLVTSGTLRRRRHVRVLLAHGGGFLPYAAHRFTGAASLASGSTPESILADLRRFWFDTALASSPSSLPALLAFADPGRITFGSDHPYAPPEAPFTTMLDEADLDPGTRAAIDRGNAERLLPRLGASGASATDPTTPGRTERGSRRARWSLRRSTHHAADAPDGGPARTDGAR